MSRQKQSKRKIICGNKLHKVVMKIDLATMFIYEKNIYFKRKIINFFAPSKSTHKGNVRHNYVLENILIHMAIFTISIPFLLH